MSFPFRPFAFFYRGYCGFPNNLYWYLLIELGIGFIWFIGDFLSHVTIVIPSVADGDVFPVMTMSNDDYDSYVPRPHDAVIVYLYRYQVSVYGVVVLWSNPLVCDDNQFLSRSNFLWQEQHRPVYQNRQSKIHVSDHSAMHKTERITN